MTELDQRMFNGLEAVLEACWWHISKIVWAAGDHEPIAGRLAFLALQHCAAALGLLRIESDASASALIRSCADCGTRSLYALLCAGPEEIRLFKEDKHAAFGRSFERMVDDIRFHLHARPYLPFTEKHVDGLFLTVRDQYSLFSSYAHGGWQPVGWTGSNEQGLMVSAFPSAVRSLSALVLAETLTQIAMGHLAVRGMFDETQSVIAVHNACFPPSVTSGIITEFEKWQRLPISR